MKESLVVSMTGFTNDPREEAYKQMIVDLRMRLAPMLSEQTSVLIVNDVSTEKYKIAKTYDTPISCVSIEWLIECMQKGKIVSTHAYQIKKLFYGVCVKIVGFELEKAKKLEKKINDNGGHAQILMQNSQLSTLITNEDRTSLILTNKDNVAKLKNYLDQIPFPIVDLQWMEDSFRNMFCKFPLDYALNQCQINHKQPIEHYSKMKKKLELQLTTQPIDKFQHKMLEDTFIHIGNNVHGELAHLLKKLIMVYGGFYLQQISPIVTHILTEPIAEQEYAELKMYGVLVHILRVEWLIDSIYINKKMKEEDYYIRSYKNKIGSTLHLEDKQNNLYINSMSYHSFGNVASSVPTLLNRKSISVSANHQNQKHHAREGRLTKKFESTFFKGCRFYIESTQKKQTQLNDLFVKIQKNGGEVFVSRADIKQGHCYYVLKDSAQSQKLIERLKSDTRGRVQVQPISYRWVNECLSKTQFIDINKVDSYIYKPFNFKTPSLGFHKMIFQVLGLDDVQKLRLKQLYNALGSVKNMINKIEITHCLCGPNYKETARFKEIKKENGGAKYVSWRWLIECANAGKIVALQSFIMDKENGLSTQESENSSLANVIAAQEVV